MLLHFVCISAARLFLPLSDAVIWWRRPVRPNRDQFPSHMPQLLNLLGCCCYLYNADSISKTRVPVTSELIVS
jgi:hypothetical protein